MIAIGPASSLTSGESFLSSGKTPLPADILDRARDRVRIAALSFTGLWLFVIVMNEIVLRLLDATPPPGQEPWGPWQQWWTLAGLVLSLGVAFWVTRCRANPERALSIGLAFEVATAAIVALVSEYYPRTEPHAVSWVCIIILVYPAIAPASPRKTLFAALASATMVPLALALAMARRPYDPPLINLLWLIIPTYICAFLAVIPATVIRGLGRQVRKARELGSYQIENRIGKGGMGEVYRAKHRLLARPAAVKLISQEALRSSSPDANRVIVERFRREAEAAATLRSPHTIELYDYGVAEDGTFYYVMELLDGVDFHELITRYGPLPSERVVHLLSQACDSLGEAHRNGLVHRDVKPSNILACRMGLKVDYVKVLDFGLVKNDPKRADDLVHITSADSVSGTPAFMAPESITGMASVGPPADVYALGCVAYWLLTGQYVFTAANPTMMLMQHLQGVPVPPSLKAPTPVPQALEALILRCLAKDPADRPRDAAELADSLERCRPITPWTEGRAREWWGSNRSDPAAEMVQPS